MVISKELNNKIHGLLKKAGLSHENLKFLLEQSGRYYDFLTEIEGQEVVRWLVKHLNKGQIYENGVWISKKQQSSNPAISKKTTDSSDANTDSEAKRHAEYMIKEEIERLKQLKNEDMKMSGFINQILHKEAHKRDITHEELMKRAHTVTGSYYKELTDLQAWHLYYDITGNNKMSERYKNLCEMFKVKTGVKHEG